MRYSRHRKLHVLIILLLFLWIMSKFLKIQNTNAMNETNSNSIIEAMRSKNTDLLPRKKENYSHLRLIYNRVPKCGSRSIIKLFTTLAKKNNFHLVNSEENFPYIVSPEKQNEISDYISSLQPPFLYTRHVHYLNFSSPPVIYINIIRDPVSRAISHFYFRRNGDNIKAVKRTRKPVKNETYEECFKKREYECVGNWGKFFITPFFCGNDAKCRKPSPWAVNEAKKNVVQNFLVVGILEEFEDFVKVLEKILPRFFKGAHHAWKISNKGEKTKASASKTLNKVQPSQEILKLAKQQMTLEYNFYNFVKKRFHHLKKQLGIQDNPV